MENFKSVDSELICKLVNFTSEEFNKNSFDVISNLMYLLPFVSNFILMIELFMFYYNTKNQFYST